MANVKITKRTIVLLVVLGALVLGSGIGYLVWRVNQQEQLSSDDSDASGCYCVGSDDPCTGERLAGQCYVEGSDDDLCCPKNPDKGYCSICDPNNDVCSCPNAIAMKCKSAPSECPELGYTWQPDASCSDSCGTPDPDPDPGDGTSCTPNNSANAYGCGGYTGCEYPEATYCTGECTCVNWETQTGPDYPAGCTGAPTGAEEPPTCAELGKTDWIDCGTSANRTDNSGECQRIDGSVKRWACSNCNNPSMVYRYCKPPGDDDGPYCGDGIVGNTPGEDCDPPGSSCTTNGQTGVCSSNCDCNVSQPDYLSIQGSVYCSDDGGTTKFPVTSGTVHFYKDGLGQTEDISLISAGYVSRPNTTQASHGNFAVSLDIGSGTLSNGQAYSEMNGPQAINCDAKGECGDNSGVANSSYEQIDGLSNGQVYDGFDFVFTNCSPQENAEPKCNSMTIDGQTMSLGNDSIRVEDPDASFNISVNGYDGDGAPRDIGVCVTVNDQSLYNTYTGGDLWSCYYANYDMKEFNGSHTFDQSGNTSTLNISGVTYSNLVESLSNETDVRSYANLMGYNTDEEVKEYISNAGLVYASNIWDNSDGEPYCSTSVKHFNPSDPSGSGVLIGDGILGRCDGDHCVGTMNKGLPTNPDWTIEKTSDVYCIDDNTDNARARIDYDIVVTNIGDAMGTLTKVDDRPTGMRNEWLVSDSIDPNFGDVSLRGDYIDRITWNLSGSYSEFDSGESKHYKYSVVIPKDNFGSYHNVATGYPGEGENFSDDEDIWATCKIPGAGIFDSVASKIVLGLMLVLLGIGYLTFTGSDRIILKFYTKGSYELSEEGRVERMRSKFENRFDED